MALSLAGETIGILGLARSGLAAARLALARGAAVYASDRGDGPAQRDAADEIRRLGGEAETGGHDLARLARCTRIVLSPGIPPSAPVLRDPAIASVPVIPEIELAFEQLEAPVIAITGTNGKTTVTALISHLLTHAGLNAPAGGNIGTALSELPLSGTPLHWVVVETSSFQLGMIDRFAPAIGVVTNLAPDHLDWYPSLEAYYGDKARLFRNASELMALPGSAEGSRYVFRVGTALAGGELGGFLDSEGFLALIEQVRVEERLLHRSELKILGDHNVSNALAAAIVARLAGIAPTVIAEGLRTFRAPPHRLEPVVEHDGVLWINDSKATNIASTLVAVRGMDRPFVLLLGGRHKGEPYTMLAPELRGRVRAVLAFGEAGEQVERDLAGEVPVVRETGSFEAVMERARTLAQPGDAVLLSPACSSFDMFANYEERGRRFAELAAAEVPA
jgi:UDP-N-acetylmuramoylalanine--D-glutamate ligase